MRTRKLLSGISAAGVALTASTALAEKLIVTTNVPSTHWSSVQVADPFMGCVSERTKGEIEFEYYHSGQLASNTQALDAVNSGLAHISLVVLSAQSDKLPLTGINMLPGLGKSVAEITAATRAELDGGGLMAEEFAKNNIVPLLINVYPPYQMVSRAAPLDSLASLQGKRISGGGGTLLVTLAELGAVGVETPAADLYIALQQGTIDGSMISLASVTPYSLQEVIKSTSANGHFGTSAGIWSINSGVWNGLADEQRLALQECGLKVEQDLAAWVDNWMEEVQQELKSANVEVFNYSDEQLTEIYKKLEGARIKYIDRLTARGLPAQEAFDQYAKRLRD
ncbi:TRAP transporter substrate-binding protein [Ochrobactrum teleogrylli]